jgi:imidazolonepropionase-like amidohydrolase
MKCGENNMKRNKLLALVFTICAPFILFAQTTFPQHVAKDPRLTCFAFTHARIQVDDQTEGTDFTLVIRDGKIVSVGKNTSIPADAVVFDLKGLWIYPSFIEPFGQYGISATEKREHTQKGARSWNEAIRSEVDALSFFEPNEKQSRELTEMGYGLVSSLVRDGIVRGTSTLVMPGRKPSQEVIVRKQSALHYSFDKGSSPNVYPSSLMGCVALLRQTHYDALWYAAGGNKSEYNLSLERFNQLQQLPIIFEAESKQSALRALKIANEFGRKWIIKGNGTEYQWADALQQSGTSFIIPLNLPKSYQLHSAEMAEAINTADLLHWYMAPANASLLREKKIPFAFTADGMDKESFRKNISRVGSYGLTPADLVRALCTEPARMLNVYDMAGSIAPGKLANFIIATAPLGDEQFDITEHWIAGEQYVMPARDRKILEGSFTLQDNAGTLMIKGGQAELQLRSDTCKGNLEYVGGSKAFAAMCQCAGNSLSLTGWIRSYTSDPLPRAQNIALVYAGKQVAGSRVPSTEKESKKRAETRDTLFAARYPFSDFGRKGLPVNEAVIIRNVTVWTNEAEGILEQADVAIKEGKIAAAGKALNAITIFGKMPFITIDGKGKHLTSGIIDEHSHIAIDNGVNECTHSNTAEVRIGDVLDNEDVNIYRQLAGGVTSAHLLHGSCNPIGGQTQLIKLRWGVLPEQMKFEGWGGFIKFALGENVKRGGWNDPTQRFPQTRMGVEQVMVNDFIRAKQYAIEKAQAAKTKTPFRIDLEMEALVEILNNKRFITCHSYVQSEISMLLRVADSLGFKVNTFTHILEGYKVADELQKHGAFASTFSDWWAYKYEVIDAIPQNACLLTKAGVVTAINSDDAEMGRRLNQEAAKSIRYCNMSKEEAWKMVTLNPAKMLHVDNRVGSIKAGKDADVVLWSNDPLSIYAKAEITWVDGKRYFDSAEDALLYQQNLALRDWLFKKMLEAQAAGEPAREGRSRPPRNYHCED